MLTPKTKYVYKVMTSQSDKDGVVERSFRIVVAETIPQASIYGQVQINYGSVEEIESIYGSVEKFKNIKDNNV
jgi:hypothetical protein